MSKRKRSSSKTVFATLGAASVLALRAAKRRARMRSFYAGKHVLITGGSRGLGLVMARQLAALEARLTLLARDEDELEVARRDIETRVPGARVSVRRCDLLDADAIDTTLDAAVRQLGPVDVLINNAGVIVVGPLTTMSIGDFDEAMRVHFWAPLRLTMGVVPGMRRRQAGSIVNISSIGGKLAVPHLLPYTASKFALTGLSEGLRIELAQDGISVTTVIPGLMRTGSIYQALFKGQNRKEFTWFGLSDSLPLISMSASRAAAKILDAVAAGEAEAVLGLSTKLAVGMHGLAPALSQEAAAIVNRVLPKDGGIGERRAMGRDSATTLTASVLTELSQRAARANNETRG